MRERERERERERDYKINYMQVSVCINKLQSVSCIMHRSTSNTKSLYKENNNQKKQTNKTKTNKRT